MLSMSSKNIVLTNVVGAYAEVRHAVRRSLVEVWHTLVLLVLVLPLLRVDEMTVKIYLTAAVVLIAFRWALVLKALVQYHALKEAALRSAKVSHSIKVFNSVYVCVNGAWFHFKKAGTNEGACRFDMFERTYGK